MAYNVTSEDLAIARSRVKDVRCKIELLSYDNGIYTVLDTVEYIVTGDYSENGDSDIRRTFSATLKQIDKSYTVGEYKKIWVDRRVRVYIGYVNQRTKDIRWYRKGTYIFADCNTTSSIDNREITVSCNDLVNTVDGTSGGQIDATSVVIPAGTVIRDAVIQTITQLGGIKEYRVDDIGVYSCLPGTSVDYLKQRETNPEWNLVPHDLEFDTGVTVWEILIKLRDLYPGFEMFFDEDGTFVFQRIPNCDADEIILSYEILNDLVISENSSVNLNQIKNVTRVYGKSIETDRYTENVTTSGNTYKVVLDSYVSSLNTVIGIMVDTDNIANMQIEISGTDTETQIHKIMKRTLKTNIASTSMYNVYADTDENTTTTTTIVYEPYDPGTFKAGEVYCFKYLKCLDSGETEPEYYWVYQGQFQVEALYKNEDEDTAFCVQKIGERLQVLSGGEYEDIYNNDLAMERASYETWKSSRLTDTITIELLDVPFLTVNQKVSYTPENEEIAYPYIIKSISESFGSGLMTITMMRFYKLYPNIIGAK